MLSDQIRAVTVVIPDNKASSVSVDIPFGQIFMELLLITPVRQDMSAWRTSFCRQAETVCRFITSSPLNAVYF
jgi:hypothetical protein